MFLKRNNMLITSPDPIPIEPPNLNPIPRPKPPVSFIILHSPGFELQTSDFEVHLHLHFATQAVVANLLIFVGLISYCPQTHPSALTHINPV